LPDGADGLIVEVHPAPEKAISDGAQSLDLAIPKNDEGPGATHSAVEFIQEERSGSGGELKAR